MTRARGRTVYAKGRKAPAIDDRTGRKVKYVDMRKEWNGMRVHKNEWEPKHPQLRPRSATDAQILKNARPDSDDDAVLVSRKVVGSFKIIVRMGMVSVSVT